MQSDSGQGVFARAQEFRRDEEARAVLGAYPFFQPISAFNGGTLQIEGREYLATGSNDYLGLSQAPEVKEAAQKAIEQYGTSCTGSRLLTGSLPIHAELEQKMAAFLGKEAVLITSAGYLASLSALSGLVDRNDIVYFDKDNHASLYDGAILSGAKLRRYHHGRLDLLESYLQKDQGQKKGGKLIVVDGVFSMVGHIADLPTIVDLAEKYGAQILVDDAHALGVLGDQGRGTANYFGLDERVDLYVGTFSKSLASVGGYIAGPAKVINYIRHSARPFLFNAAGPASQVAAALKALELMQERPELLEKLWRNTFTFHQGLLDLGFDIMGTKTPVVPVLTGTLELTAIFWKLLWDMQVFSTPSVPPGVPPGQCLIRASINASHTDAELAKLLTCFEDAGRQTEIL
ncbi:MAG: aminotransferase class I/II-fold pyridoxal phosphate-dependent enzyme [Gammaproteobacteria bacterium]